MTKLELVALSTCLVAVALGCGSSTSGSPVESSPCPACPPPTEAATDLAPQPDEDFSVDEPPRALVDAGECDTSWLPPGLATDVRDDEARELLELVQSWVEGRYGPAIDHERGIAFAKSEDDLGADPPYPSFVLRDASRACGRNAVWLREHARSLLETHASPEFGGGVQCSENVCCYDALGEYDSGGTLVFARAGEEGGRWTLRAVAVLANNGTLGNEWVDGERAWVTAALARNARGRCAGEPSVVW